MAKVSVVNVEKLSPSMATPVPDYSRNRHSGAFQRFAGAYQKLSYARQVLRPLYFSCNGVNKHNWYFVSAICCFVDVVMCKMIYFQGHEDTKDYRENYFIVGFNILFICVALLLHPLILIPVKASISQNSRTSATKLSIHRQTTNSKSFSKSWLNLWHRSWRLNQSTIQTSSCQGWVSQIHTWV